MSLYLTTVRTVDLPRFADAIFPDTVIGGQWDGPNGETAVLWTLPEGPRFTQVAHLNRVMNMPTVEFLDPMALGYLTRVLGLSIPCFEEAS